MMLDCISHDTGENEHNIELGVRTVRRYAKASTQIEQLKEASISANESC